MREGVILRVPHIIVDQADYKLAIVRRWIAQGLVRRSGAVDGQAIHLHAIGDAAVGALAAQQVFDRGTHLGHV